MEIPGEIVRDDLATGRRIERQSASGVRSGIALRTCAGASVETAWSDNP